MGTCKNHLAEAVLLSIQNLCFLQDKKINVYPSKPQFYNMKMGLKRGVGGGGGGGGKIK